MNRTTGAARRVGGRIASTLKVIVSSKSVLIKPTFVNLSIQPSPNFCDLDNVSEATFAIWKHVKQRKIEREAGENHGISKNYAFYVRLSSFYVDIRTDAEQIFDDSVVTKISGDMDRFSAVQIAVSIFTRLKE
uniref:Uncharacterized protein n=1 Tax=Romanomermis culicivorax TaxID=13658 RepID=A0A915I364_ROMCU